MEDEEYLEDPQMILEKFVLSDGSTYIEYDSRIKKSLFADKEQYHHDIFINHLIKDLDSRDKKPFKSYFKRYLYLGKVKSKPKTLKLKVDYGGVRDSINYEMSLKGDWTHKMSQTVTYSKQIVTHRTINPKSKFAFSLEHSSFATFLKNDYELREMAGGGTEVRYESMIDHKSEPSFSTWTT